MNPETYVGTIKSFVSTKGYGFIECPETFAIYGKDIFVLKTSLPGGWAEKGAAVSFIVTEGSQGAEASEVCLLGDSGAARHSKTDQAGGKSYTGKVKSFNEKRGWGLIECEQTFQIYGKDMFVLRTSLPNEYAVAGTPVRFKVIQGAKGPEAGQVQALGGGPRRNQMAWAPVPFAGVPFVQPSTDKIHHGIVKSYNAEKGWGFITAKDNVNALGKEDLFVLRSNIEGESLQEGDKVQFRMRIGRKGPEACEVKLIPEVSDWGNRSFTGKIKSFKEDKGWGFIASQAAAEIFSKDIFVHSSVLEGHVPSEGEQVSFYVNLSDQGRPEATHVTFGDAWTGPVRHLPIKGSHRGKPY